MYHCGHSVLCFSYFRLCGIVLEDNNYLWLLHPWVYKFLMRMAESASSHIPAQIILMEAAALLAGWPGSDMTCCVSVSCAVLSFIMLNVMQSVCKEPEVMCTSTR